MPKSFPHGGVTNVRNHFIEHPYHYNEQFSIGGMHVGPVLNGGIGKDGNGNLKTDPGLYINAIEWAVALTSILKKATVEMLNELPQTGV